MTGQTLPGLTQGRLAGSYLIKAGLTLAADILTNAIANSINLPKQVCVLPVAALAVIAIRVALSYIDGRTGNTWRRFPASSMTGNETVLWGRRLNLRPTAMAALGALVLLGSMVFYFMALLFFTASFGSSSSYYYSYDQTQNQSYPLLSSIFALIAITATVLGLMMFVAPRARLIISGTEISVQDGRVRSSIPWDAVTNMYTTKRSWDLLVAEFPPSSPLRFQQQWIPEHGQMGTYRICNLTRCGILRAHVDEALKYWSPFRP